VDDEPTPVRSGHRLWPKAIGAKPPRRAPCWLSRLLAGEAGVVLMTEIRGTSNAKARRELGWTLRYPTWRRGFVEAISVRGPRSRKLAILLNTPPPARALAACDGRSITSSL
jgi:hypothetical protein